MAAAQQPLRGPEPRAGPRSPRGSTCCSPTPTLWPLPKRSTSFVLPFTQQFPEEKPVGWRGEGRSLLFGGPNFKSGDGESQFLIWVCPRLGCSVLPSLPRCLQTLHCSTPLGSSISFQVHKHPWSSAVQVCRCIQNVLFFVIYIYMHMKYKSRLFLTW